MTLPSIPAIENSLLPFRIGRRLVLDQFLGRIGQGTGVVNPFLILSRMFARIKSSDSILEKIKRKGMIIADVSDIQKLTDILGFRIITDSIDELHAIDEFVKEQFEVVSRVDQVALPSEFGYRGIEYRLTYHVGGAGYPFELQLRTFLQHYWASRSFRLFHKQARETALQYSEALLSMSHGLECAEQAAMRLPAATLSHDQARRTVWSDLPLRTRTHLIVIEPGERFAEHVVQQLTGNDQEDHEAIVARKLELYTASPNFTIVECSCLHFLSFALNEPIVSIPADRLERIVW